MIVITSYSIHYTKLYESKPGYPLGYGLQRMIVSDIRYLPLIDDSGKPVGIVSSRDIIAYMANRFRTAMEPAAPPEPAQE